MGVGGATWPKAHRCSGPCRIRISRRAASCRVTFTVQARASEQLRTPLRPKARTAGNRMMRMSRVAGVAMGVLSVVGCYTLQPTRGATTPQVGEKVAFDVNDNGRAA